MAKIRKLQETSGSAGTNLRSAHGSDAGFLNSFLFDFSGTISDKSPDVWLMWTKELPRWI